MFLIHNGSSLTCTIIKTGNLCTITLSQNLWQACGNSGTLLMVCINIPGDYLAKFTVPRDLEKKAEKCNSTMGVCSATVQMNCTLSEKYTKHLYGQSDFSRPREPSSLHLLNYSTVLY